MLRDCEVHNYQTGGPGGQHRNKTASAVRLHHRPTGITVTATERRSQHENKAIAIHRLREAIAVQVRGDPGPKPQWPDESLVAGGRVRCGAKNPRRFEAMALVLDVLAANAGHLRETAETLGVSGSSITSFLADNPKAWAEANRIRAQFSLPPFQR